MVADLTMKKCNCRKKQTHPADSLWSWLVLLCAFLSHVIITGSIASFGVFFPALLAEFKQDKAITVLVNSICFVVAGVLAPVNGKLIDRFGCRIILASCFMTCAVSYFTSSFASNFYVLFATYSVLFGYVLCSVYGTVMLAVASQFEKKRSLAVGIIAAGFGAGVLTMNPIIQVLLDQFGFRGSFRALSGIITISSLLSCVVNKRTTREDQQNEVNINILKEDEVYQNTSKEGWKQVFKSFSINGNLTAFTLSLAVVDGMGMWIPIVHMAKYAQGLGIPPDKASHLYMVFGLSNIAGRVVSGYIVNSQWTSPKRLYITAALLGTLVTALLPQATKHVYLLVVNVAIGLIEGAVTSSIFVLQLQTIVDMVPRNLQGQIFGVCNSVYFIVCAVGPPIAGLLVDVFESYAAAFYVASAIELLGTALICLTYCFSNSKKQLIQHWLTPEGHCLVVVERVSVL